jgi:hypothetical protein
MKKFTVGRLERIVEDDIDQLRGLMMFKENGCYYLFDRYVVEKLPTGLFQITRQRRDSIVMSTLKSAVSWCIADRYQKLELANDIRQLDTERAALANNVAVRQHLMQRIQDPERRELVATKIANKKTSLRFVENRLTKCINSAKYWQTKGFNCDETARSRRTTTTR